MGSPAVHVGEAEELAHVEEADEISSIVTAVTDTDGDAAAGLYPRWRAIVRDGRASLA
jgi:hypothetical protein